MMSAVFRLSAILAGGLLGLTIAAPMPATAVDTNTPSSPPQTQSSSSQKQSDSKKKRAPKKQEKKSEQQFIDGYKAAHAMIYQQGDFAGGIAKLRSLKQDDHPDVANLIGFSSRKL